jgi:hypothetical protein
MAGVPPAARTSFPLVEEILAPFAAALGRDGGGYRNHVVRVLNFALALAPPGAARGAGVAGVEETLQIAAAFHDLGIWTDRTFDYLAPSRLLARAWLAERGRDAEAAAVEAVIEQHHKLRPYRGPHASIVEPFRRADLVDVSLGALRAGLDRRFVSAVRAALPNVGFHACLVRLTGLQLLRTPLRPLPMLRW